MMILLQYSDGDHSAVDIAERHGISAGELVPAIDRLRAVDLLRPAVTVDDDTLRR